MDTLFEITIASDIAEIPGISARLEAGMQKNGFCAEEILDTQLAVEEAVTNLPWLPERGREDRYHLPHQRRSGGSSDRRFCTPV
jgi:hypothetical protein